MEYLLSDFKCCPKCCGLIVTDDCFFPQSSTWLHYIKCVNCGWRYELVQGRQQKTVVLK